MESPFKRKDSQTTIAELENIYSTQKSNRTSMAWFMLISSVLLAIAVLVSLFFGGRWLYSSLTDETTDTTVTEGNDTNGTADSSSDFIIDNSDEDASDFDDIEGKSEDFIADEAGDPTFDENDEFAGNVTDEAVSTDEPNASRLEDVAASELPETGAGASAIVIAVFSAAVGYIVSIRRKITD